MLRAAVIAIALVAGPGPTRDAAAQDAPVGVEAGAHVSWLSSTEFPVMPGAGLRASFPLTPWIALEARGAMFPRRQAPLFRVIGGRTFEWQFGVKAAFVTRGRVTAYGLLLPTLIHVTDTILAYEKDDVRSGGASHLALDLGTGVDVRAGRGWTAYAEWTGPLYASRGTEIGRSDPSPTGAVLVAIDPPRVLATAQFTVGLSYRLRSLPARPRTPFGGGRWTAGALVANTTAAPLSGATGLSHDASVGAFVSRRLLRWLDADGTIASRMRQDRVHTPVSGGRTIEAYGGARLGARSRHVGYFGKLRLGVHSSDAAVQGPFVEGRRIELGRSTTTVVDYGAVVEAYPASNLVVRFDAGDVTSGTGFDLVDRIYTSVGVGWRFR